MTFPEGLTTIGEYAFYECTGLTSVELPSGVRLGYKAFDSNVSITRRESSSSSSSSSSDESDDEEFEI